ncbi:hypothetical protein ACQ4PT_067679 [Festuca glaucescens]
MGLAAAHHQPLPACCGGEPTGGGGPQRRTGPGRRRPSPSTPTGRSVEEEGSRPPSTALQRGRAPAAATPRGLCPGGATGGGGGRRFRVGRGARKPEMFNCLRELTISNCPRCKNIPVVWLSFSLQVLSLSKMDKLTTLCNNLDVDAEGDITPLQTFPKLIQMSLSELPSLEKWAENSVGEASDRLTKFPVLKRLYIAKCPKLASVPVIPVIKVLSITGVCGIVVGLVCMGILLGSWPFLVSLTVESENNMAMLPLDVQQSRSPVPLEEFKKLILQGPNCLVAASDLSGPHLTLWRCFALVEELDLIRCNNLVHWPTDQLRGLDRLRYLCINSCDNLEGNSSSSRETLPLSLDKMWITNCRSVVALPSKIGDLTKLRILNMNGCSDLKALPDEMDGLTSLEQLWIYRCPGIEEFPHGLLQRLSYLKDLTLKGCPELERRCRQGGEYFHLVSSIPYTCITEAAPESEFSRKKFLRRLLPPCANTKSDAGSDNN